MPPGFSEPADSRMCVEDPPPITELLHAWQMGDRKAGETLLRTVYDQLKTLARKQLRMHPASINPTELVHEWFLRSSASQQPRWENRAHFFGIASHLIRLVLVDHARRQGTRKRGSSALCVSLDQAADLPEPTTPDVLELHWALDSLAEQDQLAARLVELRYFGGLEISEAAQVLETSPSTLVRKWRAARAWLHRQLEHASG